MKYMGAIVLWIAMFMFLVVIHELWHFFAAKKSWVHVHEFGVWIPPKVTKLWKDKQWTEYTINWIPLWWFVRLKGEDPSDPETFFAQDSFITTSLSRKILILLWWVLINALFAWLAFSAVFFIGTKPITIIPDGALLSQSRSYLMPSMSFLVEQWLVEQSPMEEWWVLVWMVIPWWLADSLWVVAGSRLESINGIEVTESSLWGLLHQAIGWPLVLGVTLPESDVRVILTWSVSWW
jgi:membrane-associated protease RseP (regulator of RpoE activity)